jgi:hypothetical protein
MAKQINTDVKAGSGSKGTKGVSPRRPKKKVPLGGIPPFASGPGAGTFSDFRYHGGPVIPNPRAFCIFLGDWTSAANQTRATRLAQFLTDLMNSDYMNMLAQYGVGSSGSVVNSMFVSSADHDLNRTDIENIFQTAINNGTIPEPTNPANCYILFLDDATGVNGTFGTDHTVMCEATSDDAFGFHFHFVTTAGNSFFYAVVPGLTDTCLTNSCPGDDAGCSLHLAQTREQRQTQVISHEFSEMITNPDVGGTEAWSNDGFGGHENGDICNGSSGSITVGPNAWNVQLMYSKYDDQQTNGATTCVAGSSFPLPSLLPGCTVVLDRSTFGRDEVDAFLNAPGGGGPAVFDAALYVAVDGFTANQLGITAASFTGAPNVQPNFSFASGVAGLSITATSLSAPDQSVLDMIQRFTWVCQVKFTSDSGFPATLGATTPVTVTASLSTVSGAADILLIDEPNPFELDGPTSWLSTDLRVFQINAGDSKFGETMGASAADAPTFIQNIITRLNTGNTAGQTFEGNISTDETASAVELSETVGGVQVFNFAVAKVHFRSLAADANDVRVFFRLFPASTTSTVYDLGTTYRRGGTGGVVIPKLGFVGGQTTTIPCFASERIDSSLHSMDEQTDEPNHQTLPHDGSGAEVIRYFGCWLDINQPSQQQFPIAPPAPIDGPYASGRQTIQDLIRNAHQCLTAEISMDGAALLHNGDSPGASDKLAQRNLSIVASDNPGSPASHRIPNTFEIKPSFFDVKVTTQPDELLVDWGNTPAGSVASFFISATDAHQIVRLADSMYVRHKLSAVDNHTLQCPAEGVTYIPVPRGVGANYAGLLTIDLPPTVHKGQVFKLVVRQITAASGVKVIPPPVIGSETHRDPEVLAKQSRALIRWRKSIGSFQVTIPVRTREVMLAPEERLLAVLKWIQRSIPATDRWFAVFGRYVAVVADRVRALGGNPDQIKPSPGDPGPHRPPHRPGEQRVHFVGKIVALIYDRFGDFEGFILDTEDGERAFRSREPAIERLARLAWEERILVEVVVERDNMQRPETLLLLKGGATAPLS